VSKLKYEPVYPLSKRELILQIESGDLLARFAYFRVTHGSSIRPYG
jgi:hypothetical protein